LIPSVPFFASATSHPTVVLKHGPTLETLAENKLSDGFDASPALVDREIFLRGYKYLYCIAE
jgi:outer membrane protein assembly factor BamB